MGDYRGEVFNASSIPAYHAMTRTCILCDTVVLVSGNTRYINGIYEKKHWKQEVQSVSARQYLVHHTNDKF